MPRYQAPGFAPMRSVTGFKLEDAFSSDVEPSGLDHRRTIKSESSNANIKMEDNNNNGKPQGNIKKEPEQARVKAEPKVKSEDDMEY
jgi:hypothetical protein